EMEHGMDERHAALFRAGSAVSAASPQRADFFDDLRVPGKFRFATLSRRSGARQAHTAGKNARRRLAEIRQSSFAVRIHVRASGEEVAVHGQRGGGAQRILGREQWGL